MAVAWLLTLPAAATVGALAAWVAARGPAGTVAVAAALIVVAGGIYGLSRRTPVTAATVNDAPPPRPPVAGRRSRGRAERKGERDDHRLGSLLAVFVVSFGSTIAVVVVVALAAVGLSARTARTEPPRAAIRCGGYLRRSGRPTLDG